MTFSPSDRVAFGVIAALAALIGVVTVIDGIGRTIALAAGDGPVELLARGDLPGAAAAQITSATVTSGALTGLSTGLLVAGSAVSLVVAAAVYTAIVLFLVMTARSTPFHRFLYPVTLAAGLSMTLGGIIAAALTGFGMMEGAFSLGAAPDGPFEVAFTLEPGPWAFGFVVLVIAFVLRAGHRLERDTEGLV
jgi:hypothetical protein